MSSARADLLDRVIGFASEHGLSDTSLRDLAVGAGTSHRMLLYHFGSREGLVAAIVERIEADQRATLVALADRATDPTTIITAQWAQLTRADLQPFVRLFFEVLSHALHGRPGTEGFLVNLTQPWIDVATAIADRIGVEADADELRLGIAVVRGLLIEAQAAGDVDAAGRSLQVFLRMWERSK